MIVVDDRDHWSVITQCDHARLAAQMLRLWRDPALETEPRRRELLVAVREHDNGWQEADAAPRLHSDGDRPHDFMTMPESDRLEIWRRGTRRLESTDPFPALLITRHALRLLDESTPAPARRRLLEELTERFDELAERCALASEEIERSYRWLELADLLSLVACNRWEDGASRHGYSARWLGAELGIAPFPLAGSTRFEVPARQLARRDYAGDAELASELARARWQRWSFRVVPLADEAGKKNRETRKSS